MSRGVRLGAWALLCAALALYGVRGLDFSTDILNFMPDGHGAELAQISRELARSDLARTMVLTLSADDPSRAVAAARELAETLRANPEVAWLRAGADPELLRSVYELYFPKRLYFLSQAPEQELPALLSDRGLKVQAERVRSSLALPMSTLLKRIVPEDPLGAFARQSERLRAGEPPLASQDGAFTTRDGRWAVLLLATRDSALDSTAQRPLLEAIDAALQSLRAKYGADLVLEKSGANRFAVDAEAGIRGDATFISWVSFVGVSLLSLVFFRSMLSLGMVMIPGVVGLLVAMALGIAIFGHLDGMTIGFGGSLIGVTIDYPTHVLILWSLSPKPESPWHVARRLTGSLVMAALTTMASFAGLAVTSFRGFRELGVFAVIGVGAAVVASLLLLPDLLPRKRRLQPVSAELARRLEPWVLALHEHRRLLALVPVAVLVLGAVGLPRLRWADDLSKIFRPNPVLQAEDERVFERVSNFDTGRFVLAIADDPATAVARNESVRARLGGLMRAGKLEGVRSFSDVFFPTELQERNLAQLRASPDLPARLERAFREAGFQPGTTAPFAAALAAPPPPLTLAELRASPLGELVSSQVMQLDGRTAVITYLRGLHDPDALRAALRDLEGVHYFEQRTFLNDLYSRYRDQTLRLVALGSAAVLLILVARYRDWRRATAAFLPSLLVPVIVLASYALFGVEANLMHAVSLLIVMGMGVDYGIFIVDSAEEGTEFGATLVSCLLCALTTVLSFGALAISSQPPLRAIGLTTGIGITLALVLAPVSLLLLRVGPKETPRA
ncbi:MAG TPA: MMPL family transporter [Myxococcota bacterium]|nr:MMPL family transporter [Myxococcota bacterium]